MLESELHNQLGQSRSMFVDKSSESETLELQTRFPTNAGYKTPRTIFSSKCIMGYTKQQIKDKVQVKNITRLVSWIGEPNLKHSLNVLLDCTLPNRAKLLDNCPETPGVRNNQKCAIKSNDKVIRACHHELATAEGWSRGLHRGRRRG